MIKKVSEIKPDQNQPRKTFDEESLKHLAESILGNGLLKPVEIDENNVLIDGERRWRAHNVAGLKEIECRLIKLKGNGKTRLRRQLISDIQDEEMPTGERYTAIAKLYGMEGPSAKEPWCKNLGISVPTLNASLDYVGFVEEEPELSKEVSPHIIAETKSLPKEEREEIIKEFKGKTEKKKDLIREMVKDKKKEIETKKQLETMRKENIKLKEEKKWAVKVATTKDVLKNMRDDILNTTNQIGKMVFGIKRIRRTKFYLYNAKDKEFFFRVLDGSIKKTDDWSKELQRFREDFEIEIVRE